MGDNRTGTWTDERVERLRVLYAEGLSASQIAAELGGMSRNAVISKVHRLGLPGRARKAPARPWVSAGISERTWQRRKHTTTVRPPQAQPGRIRNNTRLLAIMNGSDPGLSADLPPDQSEHPLTIMELENCHCRWPCTGEGINTMFCADPTADVVNGRPYCGRHAAIAHRGSALAEWNERERRKKATGPVMEQEVPAFDRRHRSKPSKTWTNFGDAA